MWGGRRRSSAPPRNRCVRGGQLLRLGHYALAEPANGGRSIGLLLPALAGCGANADTAARLPPRVYVHGVGGVVSRRLAAPEGRLDLLPCRLNYGGPHLSST